MNDVLNTFIEEGKILESSESKMVLKWKSLILIVRKVNGVISSISGANLNQNKKRP